MNNDTTSEEEALEPITETLSDSEPTDDSEDAKVFDARYVGKLRAEAAQARIEKTALEAEVEQLRSYRLERVIADSAGQVLADPNDLRVYGVLDDCLDENGVPDPDRITEAAKALRRSKPYLGLRHGDGDGGARGTAIESEDPRAKVSKVLRRAAST